MLEFFVILLIMVRVIELVLMLNQKTTNGIKNLSQKCIKF